MTVPGWTETRMLAEADSRILQPTLLSSSLPRPLPEEAHVESPEAFAPKAARGEQGSWS